MRTLEAAEKRQLQVLTPADHRLSLSSPADGISHQQSLSQEPPTVLSITNCTYKKYIYY